MCQAIQTLIGRNANQKINPMGNMSYCRFQNTYQDLRDCEEALNENELEDLSESELEYAKRLIKKCQRITQDYGHLIEEE